MTRQEDEEARILEWASGLHEKLEDIFEQGSVASAISEGDLVFRVAMQTPLPGRPNACSLLLILVAREDLDDYLLQEDVGAKSTERFLGLVRVRRACYEPKAFTMSEANAEKWLVRTEDIRVR